MQAIRRIRSRTIVLLAADVDTDQIFPARFLTTTTREGLSQALFADYHHKKKKTKVFLISFFIRFTRFRFIISLFLSTLVNARQQSSPG